jgi:predicted anti-sigma-YlaC factor YlaD
MSNKITCKQAVDYISKKEESKLNASQRFRLWKHLGECVLCRRFSSQNNVMIQTLRKLAVDEPGLSEEEKRSMLNELTLKANEETGGSSKD